MVRRAADPVGRDRHRRRDPRRAGDGRRPRLCRFAVHRHARGQSSDAYKQAIVEASAADIVNTDLFTGVHGNYLRSSIVASGLDPDALAGRQCRGDEIRLRGLEQIQGMARYLGLGPGRRRGRPSRAGGRTDRPAGARNMPPPKRGSAASRRWFRACRANGRGSGPVGGVARSTTTWTNSPCAAAASAPAPNTPIR